MNKLLDYLQRKAIWAISCILLIFGTMTARFISCSQQAVTVVSNIQAIQLINW